MNKTVIGHYWSYGSSDQYLYTLNFQSCRDAAFTLVARIQKAQRSLTMSAVVCISRITGHITCYASPIHHYAIRVKAVDQTSLCPLRSRARVNQGELYTGLHLIDLLQTLSRIGAGTML